MRAMRGAGGGGKGGGGDDGMRTGEEEVEDSVGVLGPEGEPAPAAGTVKRPTVTQVRVSKF